MRDCYILNTSGEEAPTVYTSLPKLLREIGRPRQYQTFRRTLNKEGVIRFGDLNIEKGGFIASTRT